MKRPHVTTAPAQDLSTFERFEQLARRLFAVPKKDLDAKLAQYEKRKQKRQQAKAG